ncbi:MAG: translation elongation factor Ts [Candidatus Sericytochromatia bacterium]
MEITSGLVKELREKTGLGMMDCKKALVETSGDIEKAVEFLRKKGALKAESKSDRVTSEGTIGSYIHMGGKVGVLLEINCETDFVAKSDDFTGLVKDIAMHITATKPLYVRREDVPAEFIAKEKEIMLAQDAENLAKKPDEIREKIMTGKVDKLLADICLLEQAFVKDPDKTIQDLVKEKIAKLGENITVKRFVRYSLGEN